MNAIFLFEILEVIYLSRNYFSFKKEFSFFFKFVRNRILSILWYVISSCPFAEKSFSTVSTTAISFPLFPAAFQQLILESLQVFHNSNGIFAPYRPLSTADISSILHISNCDFIIRKRRNVLMNWTIMLWCCSRYIVI